MFLAIVGCVTAMAGDDIKLSEGSIVPLKDGGVASLVIDMADTQFDNKMPLRKDERFADVDSQLPECASEFVREFNDNTKKFTMTKNANEAQYEFIVKITNLDTFVNVMSFKGGVGIKLWGSSPLRIKLLERMSLCSQWMRKGIAVLPTRLLLKRALKVLLST